MEVDVVGVVGDGTQHIQDLLQHQQHANDDNCMIAAWLMHMQYSNGADAPVCEILPKYTYTAN